MMQRITANPAQRTEVTRLNLNWSEAACSGKTGSLHYDHYKAADIQVGDALGAFGMFRDVSCQSKLRKRGETACYRSCPRIARQQQF